MKTLTDAERVQLELLVNNPGWALATALMEDQIQDFLKELQDAPIGDKNAITNAHTKYASAAEFYSGYIQRLKREIQLNKNKGILPDPTDEYFGMPKEKETK
jgi:hypothetical protein